MTTEHDWIERGRLSMIEQGLALAGISLDGASSHVDGLVMFWTGSHSAFLNQAFVIDARAEPVAMLEAPRRFFASYPGEWRLWSWAEHSTLIAPHAERVGYRLRPDEPAMLLNPIPPEHPQSNDAFSLRIVGSPGELQAFNETFGGVFLVNIDQVNRIFNPRILEVPNAFLLLATQEARPAGMLLGFLSHEMLHILAVGTLTAYRRRGLGTHLVEQAAYLCRDRAEAVYALPGAGFAAYEDMGFRHLEDFQVWSP